MRSPGKGKDAGENATDEQVISPHLSANGNRTEKKARPKIQDVATLAGVSLGTVSAVLNINGKLRDATRDRVQQAIAQLGYRPSLYASNLARRKRQLFGVVVSNLQNPFFAETAQAVEDEAARHGYQVSLMATNFSRERHRAAVTQLLDARVDGLAILTSEDDKLSRDLVLASEIPAVFLDFGKPEGSCSQLRVDSRDGMRAAVEHLLELGHRDLLYVRNSQISDGPPLRSHLLRDQGIQAAVRHFAGTSLHLQSLDVHGPAAEAGEQAIAAAFGLGYFTAVIATTDMVAMGVYRGLQARKLRIPDEVSVVGFDNTEFSRFMNPPLTTVDVPRHEISRLVVSALLEGAPGKLWRLPTSLVVRSSTGAPCRSR